MRYMEWEQYRMELSRRAEEKGVKHGKKLGIRKAQRKDAGIHFRRLINLGVDKEQALQYVREDYPQFSDQALRKILGM